MRELEKEGRMNRNRGGYAFETGIYRPPSEGGSRSLLVRLTRNCPWNRCTFCSMYKSEKFALRTTDEIRRDIDAMAAGAAFTDGIRAPAAARWGASTAAV